MIAVAIFVTTVQWWQKSIRGQSVLRTTSHGITISHACI